MIGIDTNVLVQLAMRDDEEQYQAALAFFQTEVTAENPAFIGTITLVEFVWTVRRAFRRTTADCLRALNRLQQTFNVEFENSLLVASAMEMSLAHNTDFADALMALLYKKAGCQRIVTFDETFARSGLAAQL